MQQAQVHGEGVPFAEPCALPFSRDRARRVEAGARVPRARDLLEQLARSVTNLRELGGGQRPARCCRRRRRHGSRLRPPCIPFAVR